MSFGELERKVGSQIGTENYTSIAKILKGNNESAVPGLVLKSMG